jgi:polysaccharide deacetylase 2 family uncharacterized protein YibQ
MAAKREKGRRKARKKDPKGKSILFLFFLAGTLILLTALYLHDSTHQISAPAYEEIHGISAHLNREIGSIDNAIYRALYRGAVPEEDITFLVVKPSHKRGYYWDFTELLITLPSNKQSDKLQEIINNELSGLSQRVSYRSEAASNQESTYHIFATGFYSHKIRLISGGRKEVSHKGLPKISLIIDDLGYERDLAISFLRLDLPLSFSVLPLAPYTKTIVSEANKRGRELILHLPMEPRNYPSLNPGSGALFTDMDETQIRRTLGDHIDQIAGIRGVNNHMGSYFTERPDAMAIVLSELKRRKLFYVDSRTTSQTVAFELCRKMGVPVAKRSVFLDNDLSPNGIRVQMERLLGIARHSGAAVGIGHPHKETLQFLRHYLPKLKTRFKLVPVSKLVS